MPQDALKLSAGSPNWAFSPALREVFSAVASTVVPEAASLDPQGWTRLEQLVEATVATRTPELQRQLQLLLRLIQWLPVIRYGRRFTSLDPARRARFLSGLQDHPLQLIRSGFFGLRTLAMLGYYGRIEAASAIGYAASPTGWGAVR